MADAWLIPGISLATLQSLAYITTRKLRRIEEAGASQEKNVALDSIEDTKLANEKFNESKRLTKLDEPEW